jgi:hypothetical protein
MKLGPDFPIDFPRDITDEEGKAGFTLQDKHPGVGVPDYAVILYIGANRIMKAITMSGDTVYLFQIYKEVEMRIIFSGAGR